MSIRLSILIPAYGYAEGVERILSGLWVDPPNELEILISDDSRDEQVSKLVADFSPRYRGKLRYIRNRPSLGAIANWNFLLEQASGEYVLLLHHDEYPLGENFARRALGLLSAAPEIDVFVMECILKSPAVTDIRPHLPGMIRKLVLKYLPTYLFKRNVVGPASCLIARRALYPRFDEHLRWLVDVDAYFRLRQATGMWRVCGELKIGSTLGRKDSITASIKNDLMDLDAQERVYLSQKHPVVRVWLTPRLHWTMNALEGIAWVSMRVITRLYYRAAYFLRVAPISPFRFQRTSENDYM
jgi:glycosyltransferase involved in cell wall biosynthesis